MLTEVVSLANALWAGLHARTLLVGAVVFLLFAVFKKRRPKNYPPGPWPLPVLGNLFEVNLEDSHLDVQKLVKKYGNVLSLDFGNVSSVLITGLPLIKEVLSQTDQFFLHRPVTPLRERIFRGNGLIMSNGQIWKEQRRFTLTTLRNFGLGRKSLEERIQEEAYHLVEAIKEENGQPFNPHFKINNAVSNIICSITFGERFEYQDAQFQELLKLLDEVTFLEASRFLTHFTDKNASSFDEENLICSTLDLFFAGTETTSTTLRWGLLYMALYPEVQEKVHAEIDRVLGQWQQPSMAAREFMPYTNAVIHEVQRMGNIIPLNVPREVVVDTTLDGYYLPKGTMILTNLTALHKDPNEWATPDTFNPEHFLENGQFKKKECFLPFSMGKRGCLGEQLAKTELFIFFTSFLQKFTFKPPDNEKLSLEFRMGLTVSPVSHHICAIPRG
ncbi:cytochrome P450 2J2-like [Ictidomys tridecemlineatus]|uniref:cytochrome P450 2J2-like n=1 Tax=Ictidomys tridecemlineatus TaxID=43179 RepID=UPI000B544004|nr:cytochrome P450 2J2-like [Ictidomys tridecemlineatus]KAG3283280.1 cytochrome P450 2J2-like [Ictidomys tridecemlineatus]